MADHIYIDIRTCELTLSEVMEVVHRLIAEHPDQEIFLDGDGMDIRGRPRNNDRV